MTPYDITQAEQIDTPRADTPRLLVADLDGTLLHDGATFEERFLSQRTIDTVKRLHDAGYLFAVSTARPVSTGFQYAQQLPVDAFIYLNGALIDYQPGRSSYDLLTGASAGEEHQLVHIGFSSRRACEVCLFLLQELPGLDIGIVMQDVRYTNFDVSEHWKTQVWRYTDFTDVPEGVADKIICFPKPDQWSRLRELVPADFVMSVSEGTMAMLMNPLADKQHSLEALCRHMAIPLAQTVSFGDDLIDIPMLNVSGLGVAVANAHPKVLEAAKAVCPANNDDGVAQWIEQHLL